MRWRQDLAKFLLIEDDMELVAVLMAWFAATGHLIEHAQSGEDGLQLLTNFKYDLIILDWNLPGISGRDVCKTFREQDRNTPIIFTTGRGDIGSKEEGFELGGNDYLVKPYDVRELAARIGGLLRRPARMLPSELRIGDLILDTQRRTLIISARQIHLMPKESALLEYLMRHPNSPHGAQALLDSVWPSERDASVNTVRTWMRNLRVKLADAGKEDLIKTIPGSGYIIESPES